MLSEDTIKQISTIIREVLPNKKYEVFIFGSQARGDARPTSDIDIAIDGSQPVDLAVIGEVNGRLEESNIPHRIDVVDLQRVSKDFRKLALQAKIVL